MGFKKPPEDSELDFMVQRKPTFLGTLENDVPVALYFKDTVVPFD